MVNSFAYVGWAHNGQAHLSSYYIDSRSANGVHPWEDLGLDQGARCLVQGGHITMEMQRLLRPGNCSTRCNVVDPTEPIKLIWAMGDRWRDQNGSVPDGGAQSSYGMHWAHSSKATLVHLSSGEARVETLQPVFAVHGAIMFLAWGLLLPAGVLAARYWPTPDWFRLHLYSQGSGLCVMLLGLLFALGEMQGSVSINEL